MYLALMSARIRRVLSHITCRATFCAEMEILFTCFARQGCWPVGVLLKFSASHARELKFAQHAINIKHNERSLGAQLKSITLSARLVCLETFKSKSRSFRIHSTHTLAA